MAVYLTTLKFLSPFLVETRHISQLHLYQHKQLLYHVSASWLICSVLGKRSLVLLLNRSQSLYITTFFKKLYCRGYISDVTLRSADMDQHWFWWGRPLWYFELKAVFIGGLEALGVSLECIRLSASLKVSVPVSTAAFTCVLFLLSSPVLTQF